MHLEIVTPNGKILDKEITSVIAPGIKGTFQLLDRHADMLSSLDVGAIKVEANKQTDFFTCNGGVLEIRDNKIAILTEASEHVADIDLDRANSSKQRAEERLKKSMYEVDYERAKSSLYRAVNRIKISSMK